MKTLLPVVICLAALSQVSTASAQTYQWKDSSGRTIISDTPPPASAKGGRTVGNSQSSPAGTGEGAGSTPKSLAEKDMEFKKRQQESKEKADKLAKEESQAAARKENCERAKRNQSMLESGERVATRDDKGERRFLEDAERQQEIERARKMVADSCK